MAISFNTGATASNGGTPVASQAITIPAGVASGNAVLVVVSAFGTADETIQVSSTGTTPTIIGSSLNVGFSGFVLNTALFYFVAGASDAGKVITASFVSGHSQNWEITLGAWSGTSASSPIDVSGVATNSGNGSTITCPTETTGVSGDWDIQIIGAALGGSAYTGGSGFTQRETLSDPSSGATGAIFDSNGSVGGSGTNIGGAVFANAGNNSWWAGWTVGLAPAAGTPHTATASLTVHPAFASTKKAGVVQAMTVHPAFASTKKAGVVQALTVRPGFAVTAIATGPGHGGGTDRHHRRPW